MPDDQAEKDGKFRALMTLTQLEALAARSNSPTLAAEVKSLLLARPVRQSSSCDAAAVASWLVNSWSTEYIIGLSKRQLTGDALKHSLHWLFPQAYYSVFASVLAAFESRGYSERKHTSVIRKYGQDVLEKRVPASLRFAATGGKLCAYLGLSATSLPRSITFNERDSSLVDGQIAQFLRSTRRIDLVERRRTMPIKGKSGKEKKVLLATDWERVGESLGPTSLLSLLYRKRLKANYKDIDTFLHPDLDPVRVHLAVGAVVSAANYFNEAIVECAMGQKFVDATISRLPNSLQKAATRRTEFRRAQ